MTNWLKQRAIDIEMSDATIPHLEYMTLFIESVKHINSLAVDASQLCELVETVKSQSDYVKLKSHSATIEQVQSLLPLKNLKTWGDFLLAKFNKTAFDSRSVMLGDLESGLEFIGLVADNMVTSNLTQI